MTVHQGSSRQSDRLQQILEAYLDVCQDHKQALDSIPEDYLPPTLTSYRTNLYTALSRLQGLGLTP